MIKRFQYLFDLVISFLHELITISKQYSLLLGDRWGEEKSGINIAAQL